MLFRSTDAWTVLRGAQGVLLSTSTRPVAGSGITSTQMDAQEAVGVLNGAAALNDALMQAADQHQALGSTAASKAQADLIAAADPHENGKYDGAVGGQSVVKTQAGGRELDTTKPVERFGTAAVLFDAAAAMNWATPASHVISAGQQVHWTTQSDVHFAAGATLASVAGGSASLFAHAGGVKAIAANGPVSVQAHTDALEIVADKEVVALSVHGAISIQARTKIVLQAGESSITLEGGDITFACPGNFTAKDGQHLFDSGRNSVTIFNKLPDSRVHLFNHFFVLKDKTTSKPVQRQPYRVKRTDGTYEDGLTNESGETHVFTSVEQELVGIELINAGHLEKRASPAPSTSNTSINFKLAKETVTTPVESKASKEITVDLPACWVEDYQTEVGPYHGSPYYVTTDEDGEELSFSPQIAYKLFISVKSATSVLLEIRFKIKPNFITPARLAEEDKMPFAKQLENKRTRDESIETMKTAMERGVRLAWNNKFKIEINDSLCGRMSLPIEYKFQWVESGEHFTLEIDERTEESRANVDSSTVNVVLDTSSWVFAHEFGHCMGLPDEYSSSATEETIIKYYKPDGSMDGKLRGMRDTVRKDGPEASIMSSYNSLTLHPRHAWNIAIETQKFLTKTIGRSIKCNIFQV